MPTPKYDSITRRPWALLLYRLSAAVFFAGFGIILKAVPTYYYVATAAGGGSDSNNGTTVSTPFATIDYARSVIRTAKGTMSDDIIVLIRGGKYYLDSRVAFTDADSGNNGHSIIYKNYPGEEPEIIAGKAITGWTLDSGSVYKVTLPTVNGSAWKPYGLFENGTRATMARYPATGFQSMDTTVAEAPDPFSTREAEAYSATPTGAALLRPSQSQAIISNITNNAVIRYNGFDFRSAGASTFRAVVAVPSGDAGKQIEVRIGSSSGTLIGTLTLASTGGSTTFTEQSCSVSGATGVQDVFLVFKGANTWTSAFDWFYFTPAGGSDFASIEAETYTSNSGVTTSSGGTGTVVSSVHTDDWIKFAGFDFGSYTSGVLKMQLSAPAASTFMKLLLTIDGLPGSGTETNVGTVILSGATLSLDLYKTVNVGFRGITGTHDLYITAKGDSSEICKFDWVRVRPTYDSYKFTYKSGELPTYSGSASDLVVDVWTGPAYFHYVEESHAVSSINTTSRQITHTGFSQYGLPAGANYFFKGDRNFLTVAGMFHLNESTNTLYYWARTGGAPQNMIGGTDTRLFEIKGASNTAPARLIQFQGLTLRYSNAPKEFRVGVGQDEAMIYLKDSELVSVKNCKLINAGMKAVIFSRYAQFHEISGNIITGCGDDALRAYGYGPGGQPEGGGTFASAAASYVNKSHTIENNIVSDTGRLNQGAHGLNLYQSGDNLISNNIFYQIPRSAILYLSGFYYPMAYLTYYGTAVTSTNFNDHLHSRNNYVVYNDMFNCVTATNDSGVFNTYATGINNTVQYNIMHDSRQEIPGLANTLIAGYYADAGSNGHTFQYNLIYGIRGVSTTGGFTSPYAGIFKGTNSTWTNNIFSDCDGDTDILFQHNNTLVTNNATLTKNVFYSANAENLYQFYDLALSGATLFWDSGIIGTSNNNSVYHTGGTYEVKNVPGGSTWANWQGLGYDVNSLTGSGANPSFTNQAYHNYTVNSSAVLATGFTNFQSTLDSTTGLTAAFPNPPEFQFYDSFENSLDRWVNVGGAVSTTQKVSGTSSFTTSTDAASLTRSFTTNQSNVATVRFYDDTTQTSEIVYMSLPGTVTIGLGVETGTSANYYVFRNGATKTATTVARSTGWHTFALDYTSGSGVSAYIDSQLVGTASSTTYYGQIILGDVWTDSKVSTGIYFDDLTVQDFSPLAVFHEGFERGFKKWSVLGMPRSTADAKHGGYAGYAPLQDQDFIAHDLGTTYNKKADIWFYDDTTQSVGAAAFVDTPTQGAGIGVYTGINSTYYVYRDGATIAVTSTPVARTTGWHKFTFDFTSGTNCKIYIDGALAQTLTSITAFSQIRLGDATPDGLTGRVFFDDVTVY